MNENQNINSEKTSKIPALGPLCLSLAKMAYQAREDRSEGKNVSIQNVKKSKRYVERTIPCFRLGITRSH